MRPRGLYVHVALGTYIFIDNYNRIVLIDIMHVVCKYM